MTEFFESGMFMPTTMLVLVILFFILTVILVSVFKNKHINPNNFDERQLLARSEAYKRAFFTLVGYVALCAIFGLFSIQWAEISIMMYIGLCLSVAVFLINCIFKDAYYAIGAKKAHRSALILTGIFAIMYFGIFYLNVFVDKEPIISNGMLTFEVWHLLMAITLGSIFTSLVIKSISNRLEGDEN